MVKIISSLPAHKIYNYACLNNVLDKINFKIQRHVENYPFIREDSKLIHCTAMQNKIEIKI